MHAKYEVSNGSKDMAKVKVFFATDTQRDWTTTRCPQIHTDFNIGVKSINHRTFLP